MVRRTRWVAWVAIGCTLLAGVPTAGAVQVEDVRSYPVPEGGGFVAATGSTGIGHAFSVVDQRSWAYRVDLETGERTLLPDPPGMFTFGADAIAADGTVAGEASMDARPATFMNGVVWRPDGTIVDIGGFGGPSTTVADMNPAGEVVGRSEAAAGGSRAFVWDPSTGEMEALPQLAGARHSGAHAISSEGRVAGFSDAPDGRHAVVWQPDDRSITDLGPGSANDIADDGVVVGQRIPAGGGTSRAVVWQPDGGSLEIPGPTGSEMVALAVDPHGFVMGQTSSGLDLETWVWDPRTGDRTPVTPAGWGDVTVADFGGPGILVGAGIAPGTTQRQPLTARFRAPPDQPADLRLAPAGTGLALQWSPAFDGYDASMRYEIRRGDTLIGRTDGTSFTDPSASPGAVYEVTARNSVGPAVGGPPATAVWAPVAPSGPTLGSTPGALPSSSLRAPRFAG